MLPESFTPTYLRQLELLKLSARRTFLGLRQGGHLSLKRGHGIEFFDFRQYELGDNPRHIDWGVYGRSDRLYVKRFQEEQDLSILVIVDSSASMTAPDDGSKWKMAQEIALSIGYVGLLQQDSVAFSLTTGGVSPLCSGGTAIHQIARFLRDARPQATSDLEREVLRATSRIRFPGVCIFISDFLFPIPQFERVFGILRAKNLDVTAIQVLAPSDVNPLAQRDAAIAVDSETGEEIELSLDDEARGEYQVLMDEHTDLMQGFLTRHRMHFVQVLSDQPLAEAMLQDIAVTGLLG